MAADPQVRAIVRDLEHVSERVVTKITLDLVANLVSPPPLGTPRDTGWAAANWVPRIGPPTEIPVGSRDAVSFGEQQGGVAQMLGYRLARGRVNVSNHVPYITRLNNGSSRQAPAGFVERAVEKAVTVDLRGLGR